MGGMNGLKETDIYIVRAKETAGYCRRPCMLDGPWAHLFEVVGVASIPAFISLLQKPEID